ncbi:MAG: hypothetical protein A3H96_19390 [Acidobacteria bacterium RIFCSPLOWO2_02_FULL_67_36]|nr:MAG: hypothetical protein A3H96_19390 [Acidobacteria bacterium RIFCSPLOWO2_02_FULL_67_36]OFW25285.1 MAG: hypothetical protein A3G21_19915 [Acidobacteria bacterium RIFCSPLOWO2_12_FULL_66_21]
MSAAASASAAWPLGNVFTWMLATPSRHSLKRRTLECQGACGSRARRARPNPRQAPEADVVGDHHDGPEAIEIRNGADGDVDRQRGRDGRIHDAVRDFQQLDERGRVRPAISRTRAARSNAASARSARSIGPANSQPLPQ